MKRLLLAIVIVGVFAMLVVGGCATTTDDAGSTTTTTTSSSGTTTTIATHDIVGTWTGTWEDTAFDKTGSLAATITQSGAALSVTGSIGMADLGESGIATEEGTASGTITSGNVAFSFDSTTAGSGRGDITGSTITGTGEVLFGDYGAFTYVGTIGATGDTINGTFNFPGGGQGIATVTKD